MLRRTITMLVCLLLIGGASGAMADQEQEAAKLYGQIKTLLRQGDTLDACRLMEQLAAIPDSPTVEKASKELQAKGYSIGAPLQSYTLMQIVDLQNRLEAQRKRDGKVPDAGPRTSHYDAWGQPLRVEMVTRPGFYYLVRSAGPDKVFLTSDDMAVGMRWDTGKDAPPAETGKGKKTGKGFASEAAQRSMLTRQGGDSGSSAAKPRMPGSPSGGKAGGTPPEAVGKPTKDGEREVSLDDLLGK